MPRTSELHHAANTPRPSLPAGGARLLCLALALIAIGCGNAGSGLTDAARDISRHSRKADDMGQAGAGADESDGATDRKDSYPLPQAAPVEADGEMQKTEPVVAADAALSDDSARCGNGMLDEDELCDIAIPEGQDGACPKASDCEPLDACHKAAFEARGCWSQCVLGEPVEC